MATRQIYATDVDVLSLFFGINAASNAHGLEVAADTGGDGRTAIHTPADEAQQLNSTPVLWQLLPTGGMIAPSTGLSEVNQILLLARRAGGVGVVGIAGAPWACFDDVTTSEWVAYGGGVNPSGENAAAARYSEAAALLSGSNITTLGSGYHFMLAEVTRGATTFDNDVLKVWVWPEAGTKPVTPMVEIEFYETGIEASAFAIFKAATGDAWISYIGLGNAGDPAPMPLPAIEITSVPNMTVGVPALITGSGFGV